MIDPKRRLESRGGFSERRDRHAAACDPARPSGLERAHAVNDRSFKNGVYDLSVWLKTRDGCPKEVENFQDDSEIQEFIDAFLIEHEIQWSKWGFEKPVRLRYAFSEAILNAWKHGSKRDPDKKITIRYQYGRDFILEIIDEGDGFDVAAVPDPRCDENLYAPRGRGILLIKRYSASAKWKDSGRRLVMKFDRKSGWLSTCRMCADSDGS